MKLSMHFETIDTGHVRCVLAELGTNIAVFACYSKSEAEDWAHRQSHEIVNVEDGINVETVIVNDEILS